MENYKDYYNSFYRELSKLDDQGNSFSKIADLVPALPPASMVLDIGSGYGSVSAELVKRGHHVSAVEINADAIAALRQKGIDPIEADFTQPYRTEQKFDLILLLDVLEHVFDPLNVLKHASEHLKPEGEIIIHVPLYFDIIDRLRILFTGKIVSYDNLTYGYENYKKFRSFNYDHIRFFRPEDVLELCRLSGLSVRQTVYRPLVGLRRLPWPLRSLLSSQFIVNLWPGGFAHFMGVRVSKPG